MPEKPVKITEKFTEDRLINGWLYGNMKIEPFPKKWTRKMRKKQNEANRSE